MKNDKEYDISRNFFGGYNRADVETYCGSLKKMLEETRADLEKSNQEKIQLHRQLADAESCYRGLWERSKSQDELIQKQQELLIRLTEKKASAREPLIQQLSEKLEEALKKYKEKGKRG